MSHCMSVCGATAVHTHLITMQWRKTALMWAAKGGHTSAVSVLAQAGAGLDIQDEVRELTWLTTRESHCPLFTAHTCIILPPQYGLTALMYATLKDHSETVSVLVQCGAHPNVQNKVQEYTLFQLLPLPVNIHNICMC